MTILVYGTPAPQGSKWAIPIRKGPKGGQVITGAALVESSAKRLKPWREDIRQAALDALQGGAPIQGPITLSLFFTIPRPKSVPLKKRAFPETTPDLSKLVRAVEDSLTSAGVYRDDAQIVRLIAHECYPDSPGKWSRLDRPGLIIHLDPVGVFEAEQ